MKLITALALIVFANSSFANKVTWLGHATTLVETKEGKQIMIDPFIFKNPKVPKEFKKNSLYKNLDLILITHGHFDHLADLEKLMELSPESKISMNADLAKVLMGAKKLDEKRYIPLNKSGMLNLFEDKLNVTMVRAEHSSSVEIDGKPHYGGEPVGYVLEFSNGKTLYHAGDTGMFGDMKMIGEYFKLDVAMIPIGGNYTMGPKVAAHSVNKFLKPKLVVPIHYQTFPVINGSVDEFKKNLNNKKLLKDLSPGESFTIL